VENGKIRINDEIKAISNNITNEIKELLFAKE